MNSPRLRSPSSPLPLLLFPSSLLRLLLPLLSPLSLLRLLLLFAAVVPASAQWSIPTTDVKDASALKPPAGYRVAVLEWQDLECPVCARAFPLIKAAVQAERVPWVERDFPLHFHVWSFDAAVAARYFDSVRGPVFGNEFRAQTFASQSSIHTQEDIAQFAATFAANHQVPWPSKLDPDGKLAAAVNRDYDAGLTFGLRHTPTVFIVTNGANGAPRYTEVTDFDDLQNIIHTAVQQVGGVSDTTAPASKSH
jgi:protein-disulfide isomerase